MLGRLLISFDCDFRFPQYPQGPFWTLHHQLLQDELTPVYLVINAMVQIEIFLVTWTRTFPFYFIYFFFKIPPWRFFVSGSVRGNPDVWQCCQKEGDITYFFHYFFSGNSESNIQSWHLVSNRCSCSCHYAIRPIRVKETWFTRCLSSSWCHYLGF